jgi:hypothetical protein
VDKYLNNKKLILLLDLDNTILHSSDFSFTQEEYLDLKKIFGWEIAKLCVNQKPFLVKFRPLLKEFFEEIKDYDIYVYTHGTVEYAKELIRYLNYALDINCLNIEKLVAREGDLIEGKNIKKIFPSTENMVLLLDDRQDVWDKSENLINISPYFFWISAKEYNPYSKDEKFNKKYRNKDKDCVLFSIGKLMKFVHAVFYRDYEINGNNNRTKCVKNILNKKMQEILYKKNFCLSGIYNKDEIDVFETKHNYIIENFGGNLYEDYSENVEYVIVKNYKGIFIFLFFFFFIFLFFILFFRN